MEQASHLRESGPLALAFALQAMGLAADPAPIRHRHGGSDAFSVQDLLRAARAFPVKAGRVRIPLDRLGGAPVPALTPMQDGCCLVLGRVTEIAVLVQDPLERTPRLMPLEEFADRWTGRLILLSRRTKRASLTEGNPFAGVVVSNPANLAATQSRLLAERAAEAARLAVAEANLAGKEADLAGVSADDPEARG